MVTASHVLGTPAVVGPTPALLDRWLSAVSLEASPTQVRKAGSLSDRLPAGAEVYLPILGSSTLSDRVEAARTLAKQGLRPVPHVAARRMVSLAALQDTLSQFRAVGATRLLVIAGDPDTPAGPFETSADLLETGLIGRAGFTAVDLAGHPEGLGHIPADTLDRVLADKCSRAHADGLSARVVTQFVFEAGPVIAWERRLRSKGITVPIRVGLPGPAKVRTLLTYAMQCGVAASARMMAKRPSVTRLLGRWAPVSVIADLVGHGVAHPDTLIDGIHVFPFGGLRLATEWLADLKGDVS